MRRKSWKARAETFSNFVEEAVSHFKIPVDNIAIEFVDWFGAAVIMTDSTEEVLRLNVGLDSLDCSQDMRRLAWHEVAHWKDGLEGWPLMGFKNPRCSKLKCVPVDILKYCRSLPTRVSEVEGQSVFYTVNSMVSDVSVCRRIIRTPAYTDTMFSLANMAAAVQLKGFTRSELCDLVITTSFNTEYLRFAENSDEQIHTAAERMHKTYSRLLRKIQKKIPEFHIMFEDFRKLWPSIGFTRDSNLLLEWIIEATKLIPSEFISQIAHKTSENVKIITGDEF